MGKKRRVKYTKGNRFSGQQHRVHFFSGFQCILWQQLHTEYFVDFNAFRYNSNILNPLWISAAHSTLSEISHKAGGFLLFSVSLQSWHNEYLVDSSGLFQRKSSSVIQLNPQWGFQISFPMRMDTTYLTLCGFQWFATLFQNGHFQYGSILGNDSCVCRSSRTVCWRAVLRKCWQLTLRWGNVHPPAFYEPGSFVQLCLGLCSPTEMEQFTTIFQVHMHVKMRSS